jgi:hypothetical protein
MRLFLAWAGLGKMPSAFGMLQRPTGSIFGSFNPVQPTVLTPLQDDLELAERLERLCSPTATPVRPM